MSLFTRSATPATPITRPQTNNNQEYKYRFTWVNDRYNPTEDLSSAEVSNLKLKGWIKKTLKDVGSIDLDPADVVDLSKWKYYSEVPILDHDAASQEKLETPEISSVTVNLDSTTVAEKPILALNQNNQPPSTISLQADKEVGEEFTSKDEIKKALVIDSNEGQVSSISEVGIEPESKIY